MFFPERRCETHGPNVSCMQVIERFVFTHFNSCYKHLSDSHSFNVFYVNSPIIEFCLFCFVKPDAFFMLHPFLFLRNFAFQICECITSFRCIICYTLLLMGTCPLNAVTLDFYEIFSFQTVYTVV